jgi:signal transduction histidine kinase
MSQQTLPESVPATPPIPNIALLPIPKIAHAVRQLHSTSLDLHATSLELQGVLDALAAAKHELGVYTRESGLARSAAETATARLEGLEQVTHAKTQLLYAMSHELRTPLNAIIGYAEILDLGLRGPLTTAQHTDLTRIKRAGNYLLSLVTDVLTVARLERSQVPLRIAPLRVYRVVAEAAELCSLQAAAKGIALNLEVRDDDVTVFADRDRVQQILLNLLTNSLKFTTAGGTVTVTSDSSDATVRLNVADSGRGIATPDLERVFEPFVQLEPHLTRLAEQGAGLGLSISRDLAQAMRGSLTLRSMPGVGSVFTLSLPIAIIPFADESSLFSR